MRELTIADFAPQRGKAISVATEAGLVQLVLAQLHELPSSGRSGGSFRLEFHGPLQSFLPQGTYPFLIGGKRSDIFIVPVGVTAEATRYEAIFL